MLPLAECVAKTSNHPRSVALARTLDKGTCTDEDSSMVKGTQFVHEHLCVNPSFYNSNNKRNN